MDPIEKKPLYHFKPGSSILSVGSVGCNFMCSFCQNWRISRGDLSLTEYVSPTQLLQIAVAEDSCGVAFTYNEPMIWFEYVMDCGRLLKARGLDVVLVTNGYVESEPLDELLTVVDAMNVDLKGGNQDFYAAFPKGDIEPVKRTIRTAREKGCHIEVTNLLVTDANDDDESIRSVVDFIACVDVNIPIHFSRYFPCYEHESPPTPPERLMRACEIASEKLKYVYLGNFGASEWSDTECPNCSQTLIARSGYRTRKVGLDGDKCSRCGERIAIVP